LEFVGLKVAITVCVEKTEPLTVFVYEALPTELIEFATEKVWDTEGVNEPDVVRAGVVVRVPVATTVVEPDTELVASPDGLTAFVVDTRGVEEMIADTVVASDAEKGEAVALVECVRLCARLLDTVAVVFDERETDPLAVPDIDENQLEEGVVVVDCDAQSDNTGLAVKIDDAVGVGHPDTLGEEL